MAAVILVVSVLAGIGTAGPNAEAASETPAFSDVAVGSWYEEAVNWCRENGIMGGTSDTAFSPEAAMSRAMLATVLYRMESIVDATENR